MKPKKERSYCGRSRGNKGESLKTRRNVEKRCAVRPQTFLHRNFLRFGTAVAVVVLHNNLVVVVVVVVVVAFVKLVLSSTFHPILELKKFSSSLEDFCAFLSVAFREVDGASRT